MILLPVMWDLMIFFLSGMWDFMILSLVAWDFHDFFINGVRFSWFCHQRWETSIILLSVVRDFMILVSVMWDFHDFVISGVRLHDFGISDVRLPWFCHQWCETSWFCYQQRGDVKFHDFVFRLSVIWDFMSLLSVMSLLKNKFMKSQLYCFFIFYQWRQTSRAGFSRRGDLQLHLVLVFLPVMYWPQYKRMFHRGQNMESFQKATIIKEFTQEGKMETRRWMFGSWAFCHEGSWVNRWGLEVRWSLTRVTAIKGFTQTKTEDHWWGLGSGSEVIPYKGDCDQGFYTG